MYQKIEKEKEKNAIVRESAKGKTTVFHVGNNRKEQIFVKVDNLFSLLKHGYPTVILNFVMTYFHEILHCCYLLNLRTEQEIYDIECTLVEKFLEINLPEEWKKFQSKDYYKKG